MYETNFNFFDSVLKEKRSILNTGLVTTTGTTGGSRPRTTVSSNTIQVLHE